MLVWLRLIGMLISRIDSSSLHEKWFDLLSVCMYICMYVYMNLHVCIICVFLLYFLRLCF